MIKFNIIYGSNWNYVSPDRMHTYHICVIFISDAQNESNHKKSSEKCKVRDILQNNCPTIFKSGKVKVKKMTKGLSRLKTKETWKLNTASGSIPDPFAIKNITGTNGKIWMKSKDNNVSMLISCFFSFLVVFFFIYICRSVKRHWQM